MISTASLPKRLGRALGQMRRLLGPDRVCADGPVLAQFVRTTLHDAPKAIAVVRPSRVGQVPELLRIAREQRVSLYPISRGRNWGWGDACPVTERQIILDLSNF